MDITLKASGFKLKSTDHPNEMPFEGTLLLTDVASNKAPNGSRGNRILVPSNVAQGRLSTLVGMGLNYHGNLDRHNVRNKVGVIQAAWLEGNEVKVKGIIWKKDFPEAVRDLKGKADQLGMSMEVSNVKYEQLNANVWKITDLTFTGATVLKAKGAAYHETTLAASAATGTGGITVKKTEEKKKKAAAEKPDAQQGLVQAISAAMANANAPLIKAIDLQTKVLLKANKGIEALQAAAAKQEKEEDPEEELKTLTAEGEEEVLDAASDDDEDDDEDEEMVASGDEDLEASDDEDEDEDDAADDAEDDDDMEASSEEEEETETKKERKVAKPVKKGMSKSLAAAAVGQIKSLRAQVGKMQKENKMYKNKINKLEAQSDRFAEKMERQTLTAEAIAILRKGGHDVNELMASGTKLTVEAVDQILAEVSSQGIQLGSVERMGFKNILLQKGLMEDGRIDRGFGV